MTTTALSESEILHCMTEAVISTMKSITDDTPEAGEESFPSSTPAVVASIELSDERAITLHMAFPPDTGAGVARTFLGVPVSFDSEVMEDTVSELVNVIAGDIVARLERKGTPARIGLPSVMRTEAAASAVPLQVCLSANEGKYWIGLSLPAPDE